MIKKLLMLTTLFFILIQTKTNGQNKGFGLGVMVGEPTGISAKYWVSEDNALDLGLAYSFVGKHSSFSLHADYLYHTFDILPSAPQFTAYFGFGGRLRVAHHADNSLGARGVIGIAWLNDVVPVDIFFEIAPVFTLIPATTLNLDLAIGVRYFFE